jgi:uncharacterized membrane protein YtjA (UPF0391 family)
LFRVIVGKFLGFGGQHGAQGGMEKLAEIVVVVLVAAWAVSLVLLRKDILRVLRFSPRDRSPWSLLLISYPVFLVAYLANTMSGINMSSRIPLFPDQSHYLFVMYPLVGLGVASLIMRLGACAKAAFSSEPAKAAAVGTILVAAGVVCAAAFSTTNWARASESEMSTGDYTSTQDLENAIQVLKDEGITRLYADYWTANVADFLGEPYGVRVASLYTSSHNPDALFAVQEAPSVGYMDAEFGYGKHTSWLLASNHVKFASFTLPGNITIYHDLVPDVRPIAPK